jgi:S1-C subfamily serine protease
VCHGSPYFGIRTSQEFDMNLDSTGPIESESTFAQDSNMGYSVSSVAARPPRARRHFRATVVAMLAVGVLVGGVALGRVTAPQGASSNQTFAAPVPQTAPTPLPETTPDGGNSGNPATPDSPHSGDGFGNGDTPNNGGGSSNNRSSVDANGVAGKVGPAVVNINTVVAGGAAAGTGMIITSSGEVLTNNHVIKGATQISVELADGSTHSAKVLGYDVTSDVGLIKIDGVSGLPTISTAGAPSLSVGDPVVAMGNALGQGGAPSVVSGSITALDQSITASDNSGRDAETLSHLIKIDAPIQPGDSGGPLVNSDSLVVGMDAAASVSSGGGFGFQQSASSEGYAIPIDDALAIAKQIDTGSATATVHVGQRAILGIELQALSSVDATNGSVVVAGVQSGGPAEGAGMQQGDAIVAIDGTSIDSTSQLEAVMNTHKPGDGISVTWVDGAGSRNTAKLQLTSGPPA